MARTPLLRLLKDLARREGVCSFDPALSRRQVLVGAGALAGAALARDALGPRSARAATEARIAIVGAGMAGLAAALYLHDHGIEATIYEASARVGGRMESDRTSWLADQVSEHCGELIDTGHHTIRRLARRFHLPLDNLHHGEARGSTDTFYFDGAYYSMQDAVRDFRPVASVVRHDLHAAGFPTRWDGFSSEGRALDTMSVREWINSRVPGGVASPMGTLLDVAYTIEYGLESTRQSALNLVYLLAYQPTRHGFAIFGVSDETFHVRGGNDQLPVRMSAALPEGAVNLGWRLGRIAREPGDTWRLGFDGRPDVVADHVLLAIPFSVLRTLDYGAAGFDPLKRTAIEQLGYGTNAKLALQFRSRPWRERGPWGRSTGQIVTDLAFQNTWEVSRRQPGIEGILVDYTGGNAGAALDDLTPAGVDAAARSFLAQLERVFPGISGEWTGRATLSAPAQEPLRLGSYACYLVGQYTGFGGIEGAPVGTCHFAGEHCSADFQGYMEGAAVEGIRAAKEILRAVRQGARAST
jgi:monoamine oxidase